jgi:hypothetical protein
MPIRFRCRYCNQLIGIARRKGGTEVSCPTCHGKLTVPNGDDLPAHEGPAAPVFEHNDFEDFLRSPFSEEAARHAAAARGRALRPGGGAPLMIDVEKLPDQAEPAALATGILLTPVRLAVLAAAIVLLLAGAFAVGIAVDRLLLLRLGS